MGDEYGGSPGVGVDAYVFDGHSLAGGLVDCLEDLAEAPACSMVSDCG